MTMQRQDYTEQLLEHYESPRHYGMLPDADVVAETNEVKDLGPPEIILVQAQPESVYDGADDEKQNQQQRGGIKQEGEGGLAEIH